MEDIIAEYLKEDIVYQEWKEGLLKDPNDFEKFCIRNCIAIETLLKEYQNQKKEIENIKNINNSLCNLEGLDLYDNMGTKYKIVSVQKDPFIKQQINLFTDKVITNDFGDKSVVKFFIRY